MDFQQHYFTEEQIDEFAIRKDLYFINLLRKAVGSAKRKINPKALETIELTPAGYTEIFERLTKQYSSGKKTKYHIKDLFQGVFKPEAAGDVFGDVQLTDKNQIEVASYYKLSNNGAIALYNIKDDEDKDRYFIGIDGKGQKFFAAKPKEGGIGMVFKGWISAQKANRAGTIKGGLTPDKKKEAVKKIEIDKEKYFDIAPEKDKITKLAASNNSLSLFDMFNEDVLSEKKETKQIVYDKDLDKWKTWRPKVKISGLGEFGKYNPDKFDYQVVDMEGKEDEEGQKEFDKIYKKDEDKPEEKKDDKPSNEEVDAYGKLFYDIKDELKGQPNEVKSPTVINGWRYVTNDGGTIFVYQSKKDKKYYIGFDDKGEKIVNKYDLINKYNLEKTIEAPE